FANHRDIILPLQKINDVNNMTPTVSALHSETGANFAPLLRGTTLAVDSSPPARGGFPRIPLKILASNKSSPSHA
ncbi:MAG: hypothetical protein R8K48_09840, partial [Gallionella sp.]